MLQSISPWPVLMTVAMMLPTLTLLVEPALPAASVRPSC